ncbi:MAG: hypothetical protein R3C59_10980 [Planctomycetaceae bacterium]
MHALESISKSIEAGRYLQAWNDVVRVLGSDIRMDPELRCRVWYEYVAGRHSDDSRLHSELPVARTPGFLFWSGVREQIHEGLSEPSTLCAVLDSQRKTLFRSAQFVLGEQRHDTDAAKQAEFLINAAMDLAHSVALVVHILRKFHNDTGTVRLSRNHMKILFQPFFKGVRNYDLFWHNQSRLPKPQHAVTGKGRSGFEWPITTTSKGTLPGLCKEFSNRIREHCPAGDEARIEIPLAMATRVWRWLLGDQNDTGNASWFSMWTLLTCSVEDRLRGTCALLELASDYDAARIPAYPDPVMLGILPLDEDWKAAFDNALTYLRKKKAVDNKRSFRWSLNFLSAADALQVAGTVREGDQGSSSSADAVPLAGTVDNGQQARLTADKFRRPHALNGDSAGAAFACLVAIAHDRRTSAHISRATVSASIDPDGKLTKVGGILAKLDKSLWQQFLNDRVDVAVIHQADTTDWNRNLTGRNTQGVHTVDEAIRAIRQTLERQVTGASRSSYSNWTIFMIFVAVLIAGLFAGGLFNGVLAGPQRDWVPLVRHVNDWPEVPFQKVPTDVIHGPNWCPWEVWSLVAEDLDPEILRPEEYPLLQVRDLYNSGLPWRFIFVAEGVSLEVGTHVLSLPCAATHMRLYILVDGKLVTEVSNFRVTDDPSLPFGAIQFACKESLDSCRLLLLLIPFNEERNEELNPSDAQRGADPTQLAYATSIDGQLFNASQLKELFDE